ncbi:MAG: site-2 protease family protein [Candidatus Thermoplasmatota archaeon]|nr:site-2 protease family protein [Candidatus Thermoplasmatota archaeon]
MVGSWGSVQANWTLVFALLIGWYVLIKTWERNGTLDRWNATRALGIVLMVRTQRGQRFLDWMARPRTFWRAYGEVSLWVCSVAMLMVGLVVLLAFITSLISPPTATPPSASELVAVPGINPVIPLGWGVVAFVVSLVIHEFGHGLLARGHGMRVRSFGLLQLGPLPLGAFAEPQSDELMRAPRRERLRMFAAGPATNLFAAFVMFLLLGGLATQLVAEEEYVHVQGIVLEGGADQAGMQPWDTLISIDGEPVHTTDDFRNILAGYASNQTVDLVVVHQNGERETLQATFGDKHQHYLDLGYSEELLASLDVLPGDPFLGVEGLSEGTAGIDRLAGPLSPRFEGTWGQRALSMPFHLLTVLVIPFEMGGVAIHPFEEALMVAGDSGVGSLLGTDVLMFFTHLLFWLMWVNILLGFTNLIPMVPFDGGHMLRDMLHAFLSGVKRIGRKLKMWDLHPMWVDHLSTRASSYSSLVLLMMLLFMIFIPYL